MQPGHAWLTQHYKWGLDRVFSERNHSHAIIIEDDMLFSPDFLSYFQATAHLLDKNASLWCISTWNDNGLKYFNWDPQKLVMIRVSSYLSVPCTFLVFTSLVSYIAVSVAQHLKCSQLWQRMGLRMLPF